MNSRPKHLTLRLRFKTRLYTKAQDSRKNLSLIQGTHISLRVTLQMLKKEFVKGEAITESYEKTPQKQPLRKIQI